MTVSLGISGDEYNYDDGYDADDDDDDDGDGNDDDD